MTQKILVLVLLVVSGGVARGLAAETDRSGKPDLATVRDLMRTHVPEVTEAALDAAALRGVLEAFRSRVQLVGETDGDSRAATNDFSMRTIEAGVGLVQVLELTPNVATALPEHLRATLGTNAWHSLVLDLRFATGEDYGAVAALADSFFAEAQPLLDWGNGMVSSRAKSDALQLPVVVLINGATAGAPEVLAAVLRETGTGLILGNPTRGAVVTGREFQLPSGQRLRLAGPPVKLGTGPEISREGITPDIQVNVASEHERAYWEDPFAEPGPAVTTTNLTNGAAVRGTRRTRTNEADLVRARREGVRVDSEALSPREVEPEPPVIRDPVLGRAVDVLKGLAVVRRVR